jgi:hypothetical protein
MPLAAYGYLANLPQVEHNWFTNGATLRMKTTKQHDFLSAHSRLRRCRGLRKGQMGTPTHLAHLLYWNKCGGKEHENSDSPLIVRRARQLTRRWSTSTVRP